MICGVKAFSVGIEVFAEENLQTLKYVVAFYEPCRKVHGF